MSAERDTHKSVEKFFLVIFHTTHDPLLRTASDTLADFADCSLLRVPSSTEYNIYDGR